MPNLPETLVAMLAAASLGATFTSASPDFGVQGVVDRFGQVEPTVLMLASGYTYGGRAIDCLSRLPGVAAMHSAFALRTIKAFEGYPVRGDATR